jgi:hypothetical protein
MQFLRNPWVVVLGGGALALCAGLVFAWVLFSRSHKPDEPPPASQGGLVIVSGRDDDAKLDPNRPLRCFVDGQFVGQLPLKDCAQRNGVTTGALDVGLDPAGALAASTNGTSADLTPLAPMQPPRSLPVTERAPPGAANAMLPAGGQATAPAAAGFAACWRYAAGGWTQVQAAVSQPACVSTLFAGRCPGANAAFYGRWDDQTLRLTGGRVEVSADNRDFRPLVDPWPPCASQPG